MCLLPLSICSQLFAQKYWKHLMKLMMSGKPYTNPDFVSTDIAFVPSRLIKAFKLL